MTTQLIVGKTNDGKPIVLDGHTRKYGTYVVGIQGMGKSTTLQRIALADIAAEEGVCIITPDSDLITDLMARIPPSRVNDVILFDPSDTEHPFGLHLFECDNTDDDLLVSQIADDVVSKTFYLFWKDSWGPQLEEILGVCCATITRCQGMPITQRPTLADISKLLRRPSFRQQYLDYLYATYPYQTEELLDWWASFEEMRAGELKDFIRSTLNKTRRFSREPTLKNIFGQPSSSINLREVMDKGQILLVDLSKGDLGLDNSRILGAILVGRLYLTALSRADMPKEARRRFHLIVDEFQNFAGETFFEMQEEARKFGIDIVIAHQNLNQLDHSLQERALSAGNKIVFKISGADAQRISLEFGVEESDRRLKGEHTKRTLSPKPWYDLLEHGHSVDDLRDMVVTISRSQVLLQLSQEQSFGVQRAINGYLYYCMTGQSGSARTQELLHAVIDNVFEFQIRDKFFWNSLQEKQLNPSNKMLPLMSQLIRRDPDHPLIVDHSLVIPGYAGASYPTVRDRMAWQLPTYLSEPTLQEVIEHNSRLAYEPLDLASCYLGETVYSDELRYFSMIDLTIDYERIHQEIVNADWCSICQMFVDKLKKELALFRETLAREQYKWQSYQRFWYPGGLTNKYPIAIGSTETSQQFAARSELDKNFSNHLRIHIHLIQQGWLIVEEQRIALLEQYLAEMEAISAETLCQFHLDALETWYGKVSAIVGKRDTFLAPIFELAKRLPIEPVFTASGQTEPIYQTVTEVRDEFSNFLSSQAPHHAWIKLTGSGTHQTQFRDVVMADAPAPVAAWQQQLEYIRSHSRECYGRERNEVEELIKQRGQRIIKLSQPVHRYTDDDFELPDDEEFVDKLPE
jgi:hypothetical protein